MVALLASLLLLSPPAPVMLGWEGSPARVYAREGGGAVHWAVTHHVLECRRGDGEWVRFGEVRSSVDVHYDPRPVRWYGWLPVPCEVRVRELYNLWYLGEPGEATLLEWLRVEWSGGLAEWEGVGRVLVARRGDRGFWRLGRQN